MSDCHKFAPLDSQVASVFTKLNKMNANLDLVDLFQVGDGHRRPGVKNIDYANLHFWAFGFLLGLVGLFC